MAVQPPRIPGSVPSTATPLGRGTHRNGIYGTHSTRPLIQIPQKAPTNNARLRSALNLRLITPSKHQEEQVKCLSDAATYLRPLSPNKVITSFARGDISGHPRTRLEAEARRKRNIWSLERSGDWGCADYLEWHGGKVCPCQHHEDYMVNDDEIEFYSVPEDYCSSDRYFEVPSDSSAVEREVRVENWVVEQTRWTWSPYSHDSQTPRYQKYHVQFCAFCSKISKASRESEADLESGSYRDDISMQEGRYPDDSAQARPWPGFEEYLCSECSAELAAGSAGQWWPSRGLVWWTVGAAVVVIWAGSVLRYIFQFHS